jgi:hypothetical protein
LSYLVFPYLCGFSIALSLAIVLLGILYLINIDTSNGQHKELQHHYQHGEQHGEQQ